MSFYKIRPRAGTASQWTTANPVLAEREIGFEFPTGGIGTGEIKAKMGDGVSHWNDLAYAILPMPTVENAESTSTDKSPSSAYVKGKFDAIQSDLNGIRQNMAVKMKAVRREGINIPTGGGGISQTVIDFTDDLPSNAQIMAVDATLGDFHLPYVRDGKPATWVSKMWDHSIRIDNTTSPWPNYTLIAVLFYVETAAS